jgi:hypothetical protein
VRGSDIACFATSIIEPHRYIGFIPGPEFYPFRDSHTMMYNPSTITPGKIIILNGPSSSGKSARARTF